MASLDEDDAKHRWTKQYSEFLYGLVFPKPLTRRLKELQERYGDGVRSNPAALASFCYDVELAVMAWVVSAPQELQRKQRQAVAAVSYSVLQVASPEVQGYLGVLMKTSDMTFDQWCELSQDPFMLWACATRMYIENQHVTMPPPAQNQDPALAFGDEVWETVMGIRNSVFQHLPRDKQTEWINRLNDPVVDFFHRISLEVNDRTPAIQVAHRVQEQVLVEIRANRYPVVSFLRTHGYLSPWRAASMVETAIRAREEMLQLVVLSVATLKLDDSVKQRIRDALRKVSKRYDVNRLVDRFTTLSTAEAKSDRLGR